jgi:hypothetical protein
MVKEIWEVNLGWVLIISFYGALAHFIWGNQTKITIQK